MAGPFGLAWRLHGASVVGWTTAFAVIGAATATVAAGIPEVEERGGAQMQEFFRRYAASPDAGLADTFIWMIVVSLAGTAALYSVLAMLRLRTEETSGHAELTLSTATDRTRWAASHLGIALLGPVMIMFSGGAAAGLAYGWSTGDPTGQFWRVVAAALIQVPAIWTVGAVTAVAVGLVPRVAAAVGWAVWLFVNVFGESLGPILGLQHSVANAVIPFAYISKIITGDHLQLMPLVVLTAVTGGLCCAGLAALRHRDIVTG